MPVSLSFIPPTLVDRFTRSRHHLGSEYYCFDMSIPSSRESSDCSNSDRAIPHEYGSKDGDEDSGYESGDSQGSMADRYVKSILTLYLGLFSVIN